jgi:hypothetical protein
MIWQKRGFMSSSMFWFYFINKWDIVLKLQKNLHMLSIVLVLKYVFTPSVKKNMSSLN